MSTLHNVRGPPRDSWLLGNLARVYDFNAFATHRKFEEEYGSVMKFYGLLGEEQLYISDPKALYNIFIKEQDVYVEPEEYYIVGYLHFGEGIFSSRGEDHRRQRKLLSPAFNISHMRTLTPIFYEVTSKLKDTLGRKLDMGPQEIDVLSWMTRIALELIGQAGLGYSFDPLADGDSPSAFAKAVKELFPTEDRMLFSRQYILPWVANIGTPRFRRWVVDTVPWKNLHEVRDILDILHGHVNRIYAEKRTAFANGDERFFAEQPGHGKDVISTLMKANKSNVKKEGISDSEVAGHMAALIFAAMDTTSSALSACLHMLAKNPDVQDKLRKELIDASPDRGNIPYDELSDLPFLDAVCRETLRLFPPVSTVYRKTAANAVLPLSTPIVGVDGREMHEVAIPADTSFIVSVLSSNRNPSVWGPDSYEWKPQRWLGPLPSTVKEAPIPGVYSHLMTFLGGGHACLGFKFSQLEMKVVLFILIRNFKLEPSEKDKDIVWETTDISAPHLKTEGKRVSKLPLLMSALPRDV